MKCLIVLTSYRIDEFKHWKCLKQRFENNCCVKEDNSREVLLVCKGSKWYMIIIKPGKDRELYGNWEIQFKKREVKICFNNREIFSRQNIEKIYLLQHEGLECKVKFNGQFLSTQRPKYYAEHTSSSRKYGKTIADRDDNTVLCNLGKDIDEIAEQIVKVFFFDVTLLLYRIALIFLPLDIDLMGISEVEDEKKVDYLKDVLNDKEENYYKKKLLEFTCYVAGIKNVSINGSQLDANIEEDDFSGENCIKKIIEQSNFSEESLKQNLCILSGIKDNQIDKESLLFKFMDLLDKKIEKKNTSNGLSKNDVDEILNFFNNKNWQVEEVNPSQIKSFHDWFCAIMNCLEQIKTKLS